MKNCSPALVLLLIFGDSIVLPTIEARFRSKNRCQPLKIASCRKLGYNQTRILDDFYPSMPSQELQQYIKMIDAIRCSVDALFFLCTIYSPVCFQKYTPRVLPCRSVCEQVKKGCMPFVNLAGFSWPSELDCQGFPEYNTAVCIRPSAIVSGKSNFMLSVIFVLLQKMLSVVVLKLFCSFHISWLKKYLENSKGGMKSIDYFLQPHQHDRLKLPFESRFGWNSRFAKRGWLGVNISIKFYSILFSVEGKSAPMLGCF